MKFFKKVFSAIKDFDKYEDFALEKTKTVFIYFIKLILLFVGVISVIFTYKFLDLGKQATSYFRTEFPDLQFLNYELDVKSEEPIIISNDKNIIPIIIVDTNSEEKLDEYRNKVDLFGTGIIILKDRVIIRSSIFTNEITYDYKTIAQNYGIFDFNKPMVENYLTNFNNVSTYIGIFIIIFIYMFFVYCISILLDAVMLGVLAWILARISNIKMKFQNGFNIGIYALTLPILLNMIYIVINQLTDFTIEYFQWMYSIISYIYVFIAILMMRTDLLNRQMELTKLQEEQEKVREELQKEEEEQKEEKREKKDNDNKEEKKHGNENENEQPDGSQA